MNQDKRQKEKCELYLDHQLAWDGQQFSCVNCHLEFAPTPPQPPKTEESPGSFYCVIHKRREPYCVVCPEAQNGESPKNTDWEEEFDKLFVYTDFDDMNAVPVRRDWRPTFQLPDREIVSLKTFIRQLLQDEREKAYKEGLNGKINYDKEGWEEEILKARQDERARLVKEIEGIMPDARLKFMKDKGMISESVDFGREEGFELGYKQAKQDAIQAIQKDEN